MHTTTLLRACVAILPVFTLAKDAQSTGVDADPEGPAITSAVSSSLSGLLFLGVLTF